MQKPAYQIYLSSLTLALAYFITCGISCSAQIQEIKDNVYAFKNLGLSKIKVSCKQLGDVVFTSTDGSFAINCLLKDKLIFSGNGFERTTEKITSYDSISVKMIFKGGSANRTAALCNSHVTKDEVDFAIDYYSVYNCCPRHMYNSLIHKNVKNPEMNMLSHNKPQDSQTDYKSSTITSTNYFNHRW